MYNCIFLLDVKDYSIFPLILVGIALVLIIFIKGLKKKDEINNTIKDENVNMSDSQPIKNEIPIANNTNVVNNSSVNNYNFLMHVEDVFTITGRGTVVTGHVESGNVHLNDEVDIICSAGMRKSTVTGIEMFRKSLDYAQTGDNVGILLSSINRDEIQRGDKIIKM
mgnify:CR=1 FL=1